MIAIIFIYCLMSVISLSFYTNEQSGTVSIDLLQISYTYNKVLP